MDAIGAGMGETVIILDEGSGARQILGDAQAPIRSIVVGIVDAVELGLCSGQGETRNWSRGCPGV